MLRDDDLQLVIGNLFSGTEVPLSMKQKELAFGIFSTTELGLHTSDNGIAFCRHHRDQRVIRKIIFSESPTSSGCILATITHSFSLALCAVGYPCSRWTTEQFGGAILVAIAFCKEQLYGLMANEDIVKFEIGVDEDRALVVNCESPPAAGPRARRSFVVPELHR
jgi:hypothetical protein